LLLTLLLIPLKILTVEVENLYQAQTLMKNPQLNKRKQAIKYAMANVLINMIIKVSGDYGHNHGILNQAIWRPNTLFY
jgi:hypothetical protein